MIRHRRANESELMERAHRALRPRIDKCAPSHAAAELAKQHSNVTDPKPETNERRQRSLQYCHRPSLNQRARLAKPKDTGSYVSEASARIENDANLTDGARRCARKMMEETYRQNREGRKFASAISLAHLGNAVERCSAICVSLKKRAISMLMSPAGNALGCASVSWSGCSPRYFRGITRRGGR